MLLLSVQRIGFFLHRITTSRLGNRLKWVDKIFVRMYFAYKHFFEGKQLKSLFGILMEMDFLVDVGAGFGFHSKYFLLNSKRSCKVISFEPDLLNYSRLTREIEGYIHGKEFQQTDKINTYNIGVSNKSGRMYFKTDQFNPANHQLVNHPTGLSVEVQPLDHFKNMYDFSGLMFIKIDVQGHEFEVLQGAEEIILTLKPLILSEFDYSLSTLPECLQIWDFMIRRDYSAYAFTNDKWACINELPTFPIYFDLLFIPRSFSHNYPNLITKLMA